MEEQVALFNQRIMAAQQRLTRLVDQANDTNPPERALLSASLVELRQAVEELQVANEELSAQNQALAEARQTLDRERRKYQQLFDFAPNGYLVTDPQGIIQEANQAAGKLLQVAPVFLVGKPLSLYVAAPEQRLLRNLLTFLRPEHPSPPVEAIAAAIGLEIALQPRKAEVIPVILRVSAMYDAVGQIASLYWLLHDITERKLTEEALAHSEARNRALLDAIPDAILSLDGNGVFLDAQSPQHFLPMFAADQIIGKSITEIVAGPLGEQLLAYHQRALQSGVLQTFEYEIEVADKLQMYEARLARASPAHVLLMVRDLTQQKAAEIRKNQLAAEVSQQRDQLRLLTGRLVEVQELERKHLAQELHDELGQTITALALNLHYFQRQFAAQNDNTELIQARLTDSQLLVEQMMARVRGLLVELHSPVLADYGLFSGLQAYGSQVQERLPGLVVKVVGREPAPRLHSTVETAFYRIAQEAITNIARHAQATQVTMSLQMLVDRVSLTITDNGVGFGLAQAALQPPSWGLLIMRQRAEAVGAQFQITSHPGQGTTVTVEIRHSANR